MNAAIGEILLLSMLVVPLVGGYEMVLQMKDANMDVIHNKLKDNRTTREDLPDGQTRVCYPLLENPTSAIKCILLRTVDLR